jgi:hypothetical protein
VPKEHAGRQGPEENVRNKRIRLKVFTDNKNQVHGVFLSRFPAVATWGLVWLV